MTWKNIPCYVNKYFTTSLAYFFGINNGLLTLNLGLANKAFHCSLIWRFKDKRKQKHAFNHSWCNQYFECPRLLGKKKKIQNCWNGWKLHGWEIFDEFRFSKSLNICKTCVEMAKVLCYSTWDDIHEST